MSIPRFISNPTMTIAGVAATTKDTFGVEDPATGRVFAQAPDATMEDVSRAAAAAQRAFEDWRQDDARRRELLYAAAGALDAAHEELALTLTHEQGKPLAQARREVGLARRWLPYYADLEIELGRQILLDDETGFVEMLRKPFGVVAGITPWNFPLNMAVAKLAPALRAGNTVILKPSPYTPLSTLALGEILRDVFPPGVVNVLSGLDPLGEWLTEHPSVRKISFTGSVETGKRVAATAAPDLKRVTLELGGNDAALVLEDADPAVAAEGIYNFAFANAGQVCTAIKRVYVHESLYEDMVQALAERARKAKVGAGTEDGTELGPLTNKAQLERVSELVDDAVAHGARVVAGGARLDGDGYFYAPTILAEARDGMRIVDEEQFGPALPIVSYRDTDDAIEQINASHFGLGTSIWSSDVDRAYSLAPKIEAGTVWANHHMALSPSVPYGGLKWSGVGVEYGPWGLLSFTDIQVLRRPARR